MSTVNVQYMQNYIFRDFMVSLPVKGDTAYFITWSPSSPSTAGFLTHPSRFNVNFDPMISPPAVPQPSAQARCTRCEVLIPIVGNMAESP